MYKILGGKIMEYIKEYPNKIDKKIKAIFNMTGYKDDKIKKYLAVYSKLIKYMDDESRTVERPSAEIYKLIKYDWEYNQHKKCFSYSYFKEIIQDLANLGLLILKKSSKYQIIFVQKVSNLVAKEKKPKHLKNTSLEGNSDFFSLLANKNYNTNTLLQRIKNLYKGIRGIKYASKKELRDIAKALMVQYKINDPTLQAVILNKVHNSKQKINIQGAVDYIDTLVIEKLIAFDCEKTGGTFKYQDPVEDKLEEDLLAWYQTC